MFGAGAGNYIFLLLKRRSSPTRRASCRRHWVGSQGCRSHFDALICSCSQSIEAVISRHLSAVARHSQYNDLSGRRQRADSRATFVIADEFADAATAVEKRAADFTLQPTRIRRSDMSFIRAELTANDFAAATLAEGGATC